MHDLWEVVNLVKFEISGELWNINQYFDGNIFISQNDFL